MLHLAGVRTRASWMDVGGVMAGLVHCLNKPAFDLEENFEQSAVSVRPRPPAKRTTCQAELQYFQNPTTSELGLKPLFDALAAGYL